ncbi:hypothetical protein NDU88_000651 [Pleurodeles waltl]|uniref:Uncharacterized protein n=1 Tax=Pleurodeles waltl TaxID=8319 RepID=A0AAV7UQK4_PLEWA|nr:hypothetical protein NDU88_000651 [Pleurodeles waltl]
MMTSLTEDTKSIRLDIAGFQSRVTALEQRGTTVKTAHRLGPKRRGGANHPPPIIACFLRHTQAQQLLQEAAAVRITANVSKDFYDPTDLSLYLGCLTDRPMDTASWSPSQALITTTLNSQPKESALEQLDLDLSETLNRERYLERLSKNHDDRGQVLHAVAKYTHVTDRDKTRSPLKPSPAPT